MQSSYSGLPYPRSYWVQAAATKSDTQYRCAPQQPAAKKPMHLGDAQVREATPWRAGKATAAVGTPAETKEKMKQGEKIPELHRKLHQLLAGHPKLSLKSWCLAKGSCDLQRLEKGI